MEKLNVAVADDNEKMVEVLGRMIEEDHDLKLVGKAHNGEEICNIIREKEPDVVILDIIMPKMDGLTVMEQCSHDQTVKKLPSFIVVSAESDCDRNWCISVSGWASLRLKNPATK